MTGTCEVSIRCPRTSIVQTIYSTPEWWSRSIAVVAWLVAVFTSVQHQREPINCAFSLASDLLRPLTSSPVASWKTPEHHSLLNMNATSSRLSTDWRESTAVCRYEEHHGSHPKKCIAPVLLGYWAQMQLPFISQVVAQSGEQSSEAVKLKVWAIITNITKIILQPMLLMFTSIYCHPTHDKEHHGADLHPGKWELSNHVGSNVLHCTQLLLAGITKPMQLIVGKERA